MCRVRRHIDNVSDNVVVEQYPDVGVARHRQSAMPYFIEYVTIRLRGNWVCACVSIGVTLVGAEGQGDVILYIVGILSEPWSIKAT